MICISVTPESRTLAPADLLNASRQGDLIELCLDHFLREPNVGELIKLVDKPILVSCRRPRDGGHWQGTEQQRMALLRNAIVAEPAYVELDLDIAPKIPRFGKTQRVISFTSLNRPLGKIDDIFEQCWQAKADVVKVTWPTENLDAAWPLLAAVTQKRELPVVGFGIGASGVTFSLLGKRYGSPWIYAALERGMEAFEGQPTVFDLNENFRLAEIDNKTQFFGIVSACRAENAVARVFNAAFAGLGKNVRCLPLIPGDISRLPRMLSTLRINGLIADPLHADHLVEITSPESQLLQQSGYADLLMQKTDGWKSSASIFRAIEEAAQSAGRSDGWQGRGAVLVCGHSPLAKAMAGHFASLGAAVSLACPSDNAAATASRQMNVRQTPWNAVHDLRFDTLCLADAGLQSGVAKGQLNPGILRERMAVIDLTAYPRDSPFADECTARGACLISGSQIFRAQMQIQFRALTGRDLPAEALALI